MLIDVGGLVANKYELVRLLGRGSMGEVWVAHHRTLKEHVALKLLTQAPLGEDREEGRTAVARFRFEVQVAARLSRKTRHIVRVTDHGEEDGLAYLVMELLEGDTLEAALAQAEGAPFADTPKVVWQIARALEQARASSKLDHRCDLWALATIAYEALTRRLPVDGPDADEMMKNLCSGNVVRLRERSPELSPVLEAFFDRAFAERIEDRYTSAFELAGALERAWLDL